MPSQKEIKTRIASINSTRKITSAMKMVASSKLHHAQNMLANMMPYEQMLEHIFRSFLAADADARTIFDQQREIKHVVLIVCSSDGSLCGSFNANVLKLMEKTINEYIEQVGKDNITIYPIGQKAYERVTKMNLKVVGDYVGLAEKPNLQSCITLAHDLGRAYIENRIDKVEVIYHHFRSAGTQILQCRQFIPFDVPKVIGHDHERILKLDKTNAHAETYLKKRGRKAKDRQTQQPLYDDNFIIEPNKSDLLQRLVPRLAHLFIYTVLLDNQASEHAARMIAMQTASDNADQLLRELNLQYNKSRQQAITNELLDIVGGSAASR